MKAGVRLGRVKRASEEDITNYYFHLFSTGMEWGHTSPLPSIHTLRFLNPTSPSPLEKFEKLDIF